MRQREERRECGAIQKGPAGRVQVALVYPNTYRVGMANLGVHAVYRLLNADDRVLCERAFLPDEPGAPPRTEESGRPLAAFDAVAFSLSFEEDHVRVLEVLARAGIPVRAAARDASHPLVLAGGVAVALNPEPLAPFLDAVLVGEGEVLCPALADALAGTGGGRSGAREAALERLGAIPGAYLPARYDVAYAPATAGAGAWVTRFEPRGGAPRRVARQWVRDLAPVTTARALDTPDAQFGDLHLVEVARGCLWGCRFCAAGFVQRPYREVSLEVLRAQAMRGVAAGQRVGLVGPDTSDHSGLGALTCEVVEAGGSFSPSSLRIDAITPELVRRVAEGGERTITLAPEAGTPRLRAVLNKDFSDDEVVAAAEHAAAAGIPNVKMYFMCGLPTETDEDVAAMARLALRVRDEVLLPRARATGRMGRLSLSVNPFVPKPWTPFQWEGMADRRALESARKGLERTLRPKGVDVELASPREAFLQAVLARGDRRAADLLEGAAGAGGDLGRALRGWSHDPAFFATREVGEDEVLPWDFLDHGLTKEDLARERRRGLAGRVTPRCRPDSCRACGLACGDDAPP